MDGTRAFTRSMSSRFVVSLFAILTIITVCGRLSAVSGIELGIRFDAETRSYSVDVQIGDNVPEVWPDCSNSSDGDRDTLGRIRAVFRRASRKMHIATKHHAHIGEVRFLLPATWPRDRLFDRNDRGLSKVLQCKTPKDYLARPAIEVVHHELDKCTDAEVYEVRCGQQADGFMKLPLSSLAGCNYKQPVSQNFFACGAFHFEVTMLYTARVPCLRTMLEDVYNVLKQEHEYCCKVLLVAWRGLDGKPSLFSLSSFS